jgi:hypothetical protein
MSGGDRHPRMVAAARWLTEQHFAAISWAAVEDGKGPRRHWQDDATDDPALVGRLLGGARNSLVIPRGRAIVIDFDDPRGWDELVAAGLPDTLAIDSPTPGHGHVYGWAPADVDMSNIPGTFEHGEIRRYDPRTKTSSMVLGPWSLRTDGVYQPRNGVREIAELPPRVIDYLVASARSKRGRENQARTPSDPGWLITKGRHDFLVSRARNLRGVGLTGERLVDELVRLDRDRCSPSLADTPGRGLDEVRAIARWTEEHIEDDLPDVRVVVDRPRGPDPYAGIDAADLLALELAPLRVIIPDVIVEGSTILASPPKVGKSCLVYQMGVEVALGGSVLGRRVEPGSVLYLALEDGRRRGQARLAAALGGRTMPRGRLEVRWGARKIGEGLEADIGAWLDAHPDAAFVAIDTLGRVRPHTNGRRNAYEVDVEDLGRLQELFRDRRVALVIVHHSRKESNDDFLTTVSGTYGVTGTADSIVVVRRKRLEAFGTIVVTGRDIPEAEITASFDGMLWHEAPYSLAQPSFERAEVYRTIETDGPIFAGAIATRLGLERTSVQHIVGRLVEKGSVARQRKGYVVVKPPTLDVSSLARARVDHLPHHSSHSDSDFSDGGHVGAKSGGSDTVRCRDYQAHASAHRWVGDRFACDVCESEAA